METGSFRRVLGCFATGVTVITSCVGREVRGMTATAFMSGSLAPPLVVISVASQAKLCAALLAGGLVGVSLLAEGQEDYSRHFAGQRVAGFSPDFGFIGAMPVIPGALATITGEVCAQHSCGDHTLFIVAVRHLDYSDRPPLLYFRGTYGGIEQPGMSAVPDSWVSEQMHACW